MTVYVLFVSSRSGIVFNTNASAITDHSQSANDIEPYFKFRLYVEQPGHGKQVLISPNGLCKPEQRAHDRYLISAVDGIRTHNLLIDSPACHHWSINVIKCTNYWCNSNCVVRTLPTLTITVCEILKLYVCGRLSNVSNKLTPISADALNDAITRGLMQVFTRCIITRCVRKGSSFSISNCMALYNCGSHKPASISDLQNH